MKMRIFFFLALFFLARSIGATAAFNSQPISGIVIQKAPPTRRNILRSSLMANPIPETEPDNDFDQAQILLGPSPVVVQGVAEKSDQGFFETNLHDDLEDVFIFTTATSGITISLNGFDQDCDLLLADTKTSIFLAHSSTESATAAEIIEKQDLPPGTYAIFVTIFDQSLAEGTKTNYSLTLSGTLKENIAPPAGLVAWWPGDGSANDLLKSNNGTLQNGTGFGPGKIGFAFHLDGSDDYILTPLDVKPTTMPTTTWECWVYPELVNATLRQHLLSNDDGGFDRSLTIEHQTSNFGVFTGTSIWQPTQVDVNQWQHLALIYESNRIRFYKNGQEFVYNSAPTGQNTARTLNIGRDPDFKDHFNGLIDEVCVYNRALSANQIRAIYNSGEHGKQRDPSALPNLQSTSTQLDFGIVPIGFTKNLEIYIGNIGLGDLVLFSAESNQPACKVTSPTFPLIMPYMNDQIITISYTPTSTAEIDGTVTLRTNDPAKETLAISVKGQGWSSTAIPPPEGLVAWWQAENTNEDLVGGLVGRFYNGVRYQTTGAVGADFSFDGVDDFILTPLNVSPTVIAETTWEFWVLPRGLNHPVRQPLLCSEDGGHDRAVVIETGATHFGVFTGTGSWTPVRADIGVWQHVAAVFSKDKILFYKNGVEYAYSGPRGDQTTTQFLWFGRSPASLTEFFKGELDEISVYNRALAADEIRAIYAAGNKGKIAGLAVWPGDTDNNGVVNQADILPIGLYFDRAGQIRLNASLTWRSQFAKAWQPKEASYADANGDGRVDQGDVLSIGLNWNRSRNSDMRKQHNAELIAGDANFFLRVVPSPDDGKNLLEIGIDNAPSLLGLSFELVVNSSECIATEIQPANFFGSDVIWLSQPMARGDRIGIGVARKATPAGVSGSGLIARMFFSGSSEIKEKSFRLENIKAVTPSGQIVVFQASNFFTNEQALPEACGLLPNYPNPFNDATTIRFLVAKSASSATTQLTVYNSLGARIRTLVHAIMPAGIHTVHWDGRDENERPLSSGVYFVEMQVGTYSRMQKILLVR